MRSPPAGCQNDCGFPAGGSAYEEGVADRTRHEGFVLVVGLAVQAHEAHVGLDAGEDAARLDEVVERHVGAQPAALGDDPEDVLDLGPDPGEPLDQMPPELTRRRGPRR